MRRMMMVVGLVLAVGVVPAHAGPHWRIARAEQVANVVWNAPCGGHVAIVWEVMSEEYEGLTGLGSCTISLNSAQTPLGWDRLCRLVIHEMGHARGLFDSNDPRSVMFGVDFGQSDPASGVVVRISYRGRTYPARDTDPRCADRGVPYLREHGQSINGRT